MMISKLRRACILTGALILAGGVVCAQDTPDPAAWVGAAVKAFQDGAYERAESELTELVESPSIANKAELVLLLGEAKFHMGKMDAVIELLSNRLDAAGDLADRYHYWMAQAYLERGDFNTASVTYGTLLQQFPDSSLRLEAAYGQAFAQFKAGDVSRTIELLRDENGAFEKASAVSSNMALVAQGRFVLAAAYGAQRDFRAAEEALHQLAARNPGAEVEWQRRTLLARLDLEVGRPQDALEGAKRLAEIAAEAGEPALVAQSLRLEAEIHERDQPQAAIQAYEKIARLDRIVPEYKKQALMKIAELAASQQQFTNAVGRLTHFIDQYPQDRSLDLIRLTIGELHLRHFHALKSQQPPNSTMLTNALQRSRAEFDWVINTYTNSSLAGKAWLDRGWTFWEERAVSTRTNLLDQALISFKTAVDSLPPSEDKAVARFKWADCLFEKGDFAAAVSNYRKLVNEAITFPRVTARHAQEALYQIVRASIELGAMEDAREAVDQLVEWSPRGGSLAERSLLLYADALIERNRSSDARAALNRFLREFPGSALEAEARVALASSFSREGAWSDAIEQYDVIVTSLTNWARAPQVEFDRAWAHHQAGQGALALNQFANFVSARPSHPLAPLAQFWVADHHYNRGDFVAAELNYQNKIFNQNTNRAVSELRHQAGLMAAYSAYNRSAYSDARNYLTGLINIQEPPPELESLLPEAYFLLGEVEIKADANPAESPLRNFEKALNAFNFVTNNYSATRFGPLACGRAGDCHLQLKRYGDATNAYFKVIYSPRATVAARSQAEFGVGAVLEKMADGKPKDEADRLFDQALNHYQNVVYGKRLRAAAGETSDPFWVRESALAAGRLLERAGRPEEAAALFDRLSREIPALGETLRRKLSSAKFDTRTLGG